MALERVENDGSSTVDGRNPDGDRNRPLTGIVGPLPNGRTSMAYKGGWLLTFKPLNHPLGCSFKLAVTSGGPNIFVALFEDLKVVTLPTPGEVAPWLLRKDKRHGKTLKKRETQLFSFFFERKWITRWWQLKYFLFSSLPGEMIQF